jgi:isoprenylcysteine carboxyl methyltransferase (ICMT) family protein YpbQ
MGKLKTFWNLKITIPPSQELKMSVFLESSKHPINEIYLLTLLNIG